MLKKLTRTPKNYDGCEVTSQRLSDVLSHVLKGITDTHQERPDLVLAAWPSIVGEKLAPMTQAVSFFEGVLVVKVKNSTLYSLLCQHEKARLVKALKAKFPKVYIKAIHFRMG